ncbi:hypothetical protein Ancab_019772 [Ancistrocladus abbreviatus]
MEVSMQIEEGIEGRRRGGSRTIDEGEAYEVCSKGNGGGLKGKKADVLDNIVPGNITAYAWRWLLNKLPTRGNLGKRGVIRQGVEDRCGFCNKEEVLTEHKNEVWFVQFSNNGEYLASSSSDCTAIIWKVLEDGKFTMKHTLSSHQKPVSFVAWSPDDTMLLTCGNVEVVKLWDFETGTCKRTFGDHGFTISSCAWFPDSKRLVCRSSDPEKGIYMWDYDGNEIRVWRGMRMPKVLDLAVTADGNNLISVLSDTEIRKLNVVTNVERVISEEHSITSLSVSVDGNYFVVNLNSQEIHMWDVAGEWQKPLKYTGHKQRKYVIRSCFGGFDSAFIASGSENSEVRPFLFLCCCPHY